MYKQDSRQHKLANTDADAAGLDAEARHSSSGTQRHLTAQTVSTPESSASRSAAAADLEGGSQDSASHATPELTEAECHRKFGVPTAGLYDTVKQRPRQKATTAPAFSAAWGSVSYSWNPWFPAHACLLYRWLHLLCLREVPALTYGKCLMVSARARAIQYARCAMILLHLFQLHGFASQETTPLS